MKRSIFLAFLVVLAIEAVAALVLRIAASVGAIQIAPHAPLAALLDAAHLGVFCMIGILASTHRLLRRLVLGVLLAFAVVAAVFLRDDPWLVAGYAGHAALYALALLALRRESGADPGRLVPGRE